MRKFFVNYAVVEIYLLAKNGERFEHPDRVIENSRKYVI